MDDMPRSTEGYPLSLYDQMSEWADGRLATDVAIQLGGFSSFWELAKTTIEHNIPLRRNFTETEAALASVADRTRQDPPRLDAHAITERTKLLYQQIYAVTVDANPTLIAEAIAMLEQDVASDGGYAGDRLWLDLLKTLPWAEVRALAIADTEDSRALRSSNPFARLIGVKDVETRRAIWRLAKVQLMLEAAPGDCDTSRNEGQAQA
jgi:hypothetical protein